MAKTEYKMTVLEKYLATGYLDLGDRNVTALDRLGAGNRLFADYYLGKAGDLSITDISRIRVDGSRAAGEAAKRLYHLDCYAKAMKSVPAEFWPVVRRVVIENEPLTAAGSKLEVKRNLYAQRLDLCRGLDRLVKFYWRNHKKRS